MRVLSQIAFVALLIFAVLWFWRSPLKESLLGAPDGSGALVEGDDQRAPLRPFASAPQPSPPPTAAGDAPEPVQPGAALVVELVEDPATHYGQPRFAESDRHYEGFARRIDGLRYEPALGHAARELAGFHSQNGRLASGEILSFLLDAGGAAEWTVEQLLTITTQEGDAPIEALLQRARESWRRGAPPVRVGVGEAWTLGRPARRHLIALVSRGRLELDRVSRTVAAGASLEVSGRVPSAIPQVDILVMGPDLVVKDASVTRRGDRFQAVIPMGETPGQTWIELIGDGPAGPKPMAQLSVFVGQDLPWSFETAWPPDESHLKSPAQAEAHAFRLFLADRHRFGLPAVTRDAALDAVARAHSEDMARNRFFGHVSPTTGSVSDRLGAAGLRTVFHGENIARNAALSDAEAGLMRSIGHRRNILHPRATQVGIGVAQVGSGEGRQWALTQVVARPAPVIDPATVAREVFEVIDAARVAASQRPFRSSKALTRAAREEAESMSPSPRGVLDRAESSLTRGGWAWVATVGELGDLEVPEDVLDPSWKHLGVGVVQDPERQGANIVVVLVVGG